jgi:aspartate-semialdehyde dehydrogenase
MDKLSTGILGATGAAGIEFVRSLINHPWFEIKELYASEKSTGKTLEQACALNITDVPDNIKKLIIKNTEDVNIGLDLICSALPSKQAKKLEPKCAKHTPVISTTSAYRYEDDVPIIMLEINGETHYELLKTQKNRGWKGWIAPGPNCTTVGLAMALQPIYKEIGIKEVIMTSYQSISGGGYPLITQWEKEKSKDLPYPLKLEEAILNPKPRLEGNVIGYIEEEEPKVKKEIKKILGNYENGKIKNAEFKIDCTCVRVPTLYGHFEPIFIKTKKECTIDEIKEIYKEFNNYCKKEFGNLPSSPKQTIIVLDRPPQPYYDANIGGGMSTIIGRIEKSSVFDIKLQALSNNTERGAAKGVVQVAEYLYKKGIL